LAALILVVGPGAWAQSSPQRGGELLLRHPVPTRRESLGSRVNGRSLLASVAEETPPPAASDRDRDRIVRMQAALHDIVHSVTLGRLQVGLRVVEARTGRLFFGRGAGSLMDPASNQKLLATTTALVRLGSDWRFRTEVYGPPPDPDGVVRGNLYLRGSGDPTVHTAEIDELATSLVNRGVTAVDGAIVADPRRIGDEGPPPWPDERPSLVVNRGIFVVHVRPTAVGEAPEVIVDPVAPVDASGVPLDLVVTNSARTQAPHRGRLAVQVDAADGVVRVDVSGTIGFGGLADVFRRRVVHMPLASAILLRGALLRVGVRVRDRASIGTRPARTELLATHLSAPLALLLRQINKDSDNDEAERLLETVGAEVLGGSATTEKGLTVLRAVISDLGLDPRSYLPQNASGLGHGNRITAMAMTKLLRALYLDPRVGPELLQSLSVGGVDGTTRNRFRGTLAAHHVRAKTGTLTGKSVLSGLVGDGDDVVVFSIMVQGIRGRALAAVRGAQVAAVETMMRYVKERGGARIDLTPAFEQASIGTDYEPGEEVMFAEGEAAEEETETSTEQTAADASEPVATTERSAISMPVFAGNTTFGIGGLGSLAGGDAAFGVRGHVDLAFPDSAIGVELSLFGTTSRTLDGPGTGLTDWTRYVVGAGPRYRLTFDRIAIDLRAQVAAGLYVIKGRDYAVNTSSQTMAVGFGSGARLTWDREGIMPWVGLDVMTWLGDHTIEVQGVADQRSIPALDLLLSVGGSYRL
jgi:D-alanyl-D-alanine carboxypeptidase/D-alanyl-D-alanine-endopeptidase (penicillin-binding protein 4)